MSSSFGLPQSAIDYLVAANPAEHPALAACREATVNHPMARMQISPEQAAFLQFLIGLTEARIAVEVGVFTGYSALATALALRQSAGPGAHLIGLDTSTDYTDLAKPHWAAAGVEDIIRLRIGPAANSLQALIDEGYADTVDFIFVDADKTGYPAYYELGLELLHPGAIMVFDNVLWGGAVADPGITDADTEALRQTAEKARDDDRVTSTMIAVGDGLLLVRKR